MSGTSVRNREIPPFGCIAFVGWLILANEVSNSYHWGWVVKVLLSLVAVPLGIAVFVLVEWLRQRESDRRNDELLPVIRYYRELGFFSQYAGRADVAIRDELLTEMKAELGTTTIPEDQIDAYVLSFDDTRVRWQSPECANRYKHALEEWAEISRGLFQPVDISQRWATVNGRPVVTFTHDGRRHTVEMDGGRGTMEIQLLEYVNSLISHTDLRFRNLRPDPEMCIVLLADDEAERIGRDRGLQIRP